METSHLSQARSYFAHPAHGPLPALLLLLTFGTGLVDAIPAPGAPAPTPAPLGGCELPMAPPQAFELPMVQSSPSP